MTSKKPMALPIIQSTPTKGHFPHLTRQHRRKYVCRVEKNFLEFAFIQINFKFRFDRWSPWLSSKFNSLPHCIKVCISTHY